MNYGGAFDIDPEMYWTRDDLNELMGEINEKLENEGIEITAMYLDHDNIFDIEFRDSDENEYSLPKTVVADPMKIETPQNLIKTFTPILSEMMIKQVREFQEQIAEMG